LHSSLCTLLTSTATIPECEHEAHSISKFGYKMLFSKYLSSLTGLEANLSIIMHNKSLINLQDPTLQEINTLNFDFLRNVMTLWRGEIYQIIYNKIEGEKSLKLVILAILVAFIGSGYLIVWLPFLFQLRDNVNYFIKTILRYPGRE
jgi:hypothetical protein